MIETYANAHALAEAAAKAVAARLETGLRTRPRATLVATGGRSPGMTYDRLGATGLLDWARVVVTLSDERCVAADAPESNARLVRERLLAGQAAKAHLVPLWPKPDAAALRALLPFDAVMLGMGEDGHVASLIPGDPGLAQAMDPRAGTLLADVPEGLGSPPLARVTLTLSALLASRAIFLLIAGGAKREVVERALAGEDLPVGRILVQEQVPVRVLWGPSFER
ncbi:MAG TPA: 6-phosphogluconolactonase [Phenylobacterium sp.]|uniref:6-phosphogluconolactonase n=1 Tax=Phenylobacterium sp. TaxID=1871053 RepID=UPI002BC36965|nr:6-phosphogluconolactonase [Phenylobacterium sp.]HSV02625.1 6-phosphogluconolactonase [Phenylobacterium sp.]